MELKQEVTDREEMEVQLRRVGLEQVVPALFEQNGVRLEMLMDPELRRQWMPEGMEVVLLVNMGLTAADALKLKEAMRQGKLQLAPGKRSMRRCFSAKPAAGAGESPGKTPR